MRRFRASCKATVRLSVAWKNAPACRAARNLPLRRVAHDLLIRAHGGPFASRDVERVRFQKSMSCLRDGATAASVSRHGIAWLVQARDPAQDGSVVRLPTWRPPVRNDLFTTTFWLAWRFMQQCRRDISSPVERYGSVFSTYCVLLFSSCLARFLLFSLFLFVLLLLFFCFCPFAFVLLPRRASPSKLHGHKSWEHA